MDPLPVAMFVFFSRGFQLLSYIPAAERAMLCASEYFPRQYSMTKMYTNRLFGFLHGVIYRKNKSSPSRFSFSTTGSGSFCFLLTRFKPVLLLPVGTLRFPSIDTEDDNDLVVTVTTGGWKAEQ